mgnify:CR=1 FL=1
MDILFKSFPIGVPASAHKGGVQNLLDACTKSGQMPYFHAPDEAYINALISKDYETVIAFKGKEIVAVGGAVPVEKLPVEMAGQLKTFLKAPALLAKAAFFDGAIVHPRLRQRGLGHEIARRRCEALAKKGGYDYIFATAHLENIASVKVLEKCGFKPLKTMNFFSGQTPRTLYFVASVEC